MGQSLALETAAMTGEPQASRPFMPGYGIQPASEGTGLLPWSWAEERLVRAHDYWLATVWPDGRPHVMPVWGVWAGGALWFSCGGRSRKTRNIAANPRCVATTDNALEPVVVEGDAEVVTDLDRVAQFAAGENAKYGTDYPVSFFDPAVNATFRLEPVWAFGLAEGDFSGSPTRWELPGPE